MAKTTDETWADYARGIKPLRGRAAPPPPRTPAPAPQPVAPRVAASHIDVATPDRRTLENLKRGRMRPEARLDLHGMTRDEAFEALSGFVARAQAIGIRVALVITGRSGVLRDEVPRWLTMTALRPRILGMAEAKPRDGGAGALYVLIRRPKT
jgi:DNA-nicking Smr family endonuclease